MKKKLVASLLALSLLTTAMVPVIAAGTELEGDSEYASGVLQILAPTAADLKFYINPLGLGETADGNGILSQITPTKDLVFVNKSNVPLKLDVKVNTTVKSDVTLANGAATGDAGSDGAVYDDEANTKKQVYLELVAAKSAAPVSAANPAKELYDTVVYNDLGATDLSVPIETKGTKTDTDATLQFYLAAAKYDGTDLLAQKESDYQEAAGVTGVAAMRLAGTVNSFVSYADNDVKVNLVYDLLGLKSTVYAKAITDSDLDALNVYNAIPAKKVPAVAPIISLNKGGTYAKTDDIVITIDNFGAQTYGDVEEIYVAFGGTAYPYMDEDAVTYNKVAGTVTIGKASVEYMDSGQKIALEFANGEKVETAAITIS